MNRKKLSESENGAPQGSAAAPETETPATAKPKPVRRKKIAVKEKPAPAAKLAKPAEDPLLLELKKLSPNKLLTVEQVLTLIPLSKSAWLAGVRQGRYPQARKVSKRSLFWRVQDIDDFLRYIDDVAAPNEG